MAKDIIQDLWDRGREEQTMTSAQIQTLLEPRIRRNAFSLRMWIWLYLAVLVLTLILNGINIFSESPVSHSVPVTFPTPLKTGSCSDSLLSRDDGSVPHARIIQDSRSLIIQRVRPYMFDAHAKELHFIELIEIRTRHAGVEYLA